MYCLHCGAELNKKDILCLRCGTPVLTEDDITLMPNAVTTRFINEAHNNTGPIYKDSSASIDLTQHVNASTTSSLSQKNSDRQKNDSEYGEKPDKMKNRKTAIKTSILMGAVLIGITAFFLYYMLQPTAPRHGGADPSLPPSSGTESTDGMESNDGEEQAGSENGIAESYEITGINIFRDRVLQTEIHAMVDEVHILDARLVPIEAEGNIKWISSDPDVLEVVLTSPDGSEASITGKAVGVSDLIITAGDIEVRFIVNVGRHLMREHLESALADDDTTIWLTITWSSGPDFQKVILFERDIDNDVWFREDETGRVEADIDFTGEEEALTMMLRGSPNVYSLFANGTGQMEAPDGKIEVFSWWFTSSED